MEKKKIGFIGLGTMGKGMVEQLLTKDFHVIVYNRTVSKTNELQTKGARVAASIAELTHSSDIVITMVSDDFAIEQIYYGEHGIMKGIHPNLTVIDCSTISPQLTQKIASDLSAQAVHLLDAPVTGSKPAAMNGTLVFMVGGDKQVLEANKDIFYAMGQTIIYMGKSGNGQKAKLAHNTIVGINNVALAEGFAMVAKSGIDPDAFLKLILAGSASSKAAELKGQKIIDQDYSVQFSLQLMLKDLKLASQMTDQLQLPTPMLEAAKSMFQMSQASGHGPEDLCIISKCYESAKTRDQNHA